MVGGRCGYDPRIKPRCHSKRLHNGTHFIDTVDKLVAEYPYIFLLFKIITIERRMHTKRKYSAGFWINNNASTSGRTPFFLHLFKLLLKKKLDRRLDGRHNIAAFTIIAGNRFS